VSAASNSRAAFIDGIGFWASRMPGWETAASILRGELAPPANAARRPTPELLPPTERRRAPDTVALALEVASRACESASADPSRLASVFASTHGDLTISDYMCETVANTPALTSPIRFHNSVHNAAAGYWSIATGCYAPYTAISAFDDTFGEGLLEALAQVAASGEPVLYVVYDIEARGPMATLVPSRGLLAAALVLSPRLTAASRARLDWGIRPGQRNDVTPARPTSLALVDGNSMASCLSLFEVLAGAGAGRVTVSLASSLLLDLDLVRANV
jgi:hypothetical protein